MVAVADSTPVEEVGGILAVPKGGVEKVGRDFFREGWVEEHCITTSQVDLEEELVHMDMYGEEKDQEEEEVEGEVGTLEEVVEIMNGILVEVEEDPLILETIRNMNVVTRDLAMVG